MTPSRLDQPALLFWSSGVSSVPGYSLAAEREWSKTCLERHKKDPSYDRPAFIIVLKSWKVPAQPE